MNFKSINDKQLKNGQLRLTEPSVLFGENVQILTEHVVSFDEVGRIDIISRKYYGGENMAEYILKYNNVANPFSINEGDVLKIPSINAELIQWQRIKAIDDIMLEIDNIRGQFLDTKRLSKKDANRLEYLQRKAEQLKNGSKAVLPPNLLKPGEENLSIRDGKITF